MITNIGSGSGWLRYRKHFMAYATDDFMCDKCKHLTSSLLNKKSRILQKDEATNGVLSSFQVFIPIYKIALKLHT